MYQKELGFKIDPETKEYLIPDEHKEEVLQQLYPFENCPSLDTVLYDLHMQKTFVCRDYRVVREGDFNSLMSSFKGGGSVIDWMPEELGKEHDKMNNGY